MAAEASYWTPPAGQHQVSLGKSMSRFLKQRKGVQQPGQSRPLPTSSFYHFRYKFMPESVDTSKPGVLELTTKDVTTARVERASQQSDEVHVFRGQEEPAKEVDCVLIYDPESGAFTLEKLDSNLTLQYESRGPPKNHNPSASPVPTEPLPTALAPTDQAEEQDRLFRVMKKGLGGETNDSDEEDIPLSASSKIVADKRKQAVTHQHATLASTGAPPSATAGPRSKPKLKAGGQGAAAPASTPSSKSKAVTRPPTKKNTSTKQLASPIQATSTSKPAPKLKSKQRAIDIDEEVLEFGKPAHQAAETQPLSSTLSNALALPNASSSGGGLALPTSPSNEFVSLPGGPSQVQEEEEDDDEWDQVAGPGEVQASASVAPVTSAEPGADDESLFSDHKFQDEMEEIDINVEDFAAQMDQELLENLEEEKDEDEDMFDDMDEVTPPQNLKPVSLNQFVGGEAEGEFDEDDYTSSEESDDD